MLSAEKIFVKKHVYASKGCVSIFTLMMDTAVNRTAGSVFVSKNYILTLE